MNLLTQLIEMRKLPFYTGANRESNNVEFRAQSKAYRDFEEKMEKATRAIKKGTDVVFNIRKRVKSKNPKYPGDCELIDNLMEGKFVKIKTKRRTVCGEVNEIVCAVVETTTHIYECDLTDVSTK